MSTRKTTINFEALRRFERKWLEQHALGTFSGHIGHMWQQIGVVYLAFVRRRFIIHSRGGGDWKPLKRIRTRDRAALKRTYRRGGQGAYYKKLQKGSAILRDTGTLLNALTVDQPGNKFERIPYGLRVGFGGPERHGKGKATIRDIAVYHDQGKGNLPKRQIIVAPTPTVGRRIINIIKTSVAKLERESEYGS